MRNTKYVLCILSAIALFAPCSGADAAFASRFDKITPVKVPAWALPGLNQRHVDIAAAEKMPQAADWSIAWGNYSDGCRFYVRDSGWGIASTKPLSIYSIAICRSSGKNWRISFEAAMPADAEIGSSSRCRKTRNA